MVETKVVSRAAAFVFYIGDCFFGTVTAHVAGAEAAQYEFTSALTTQVLKSIAPALQPLIDRSRAEHTADGTVCTTTEVREASIGGADAPNAKVPPARAAASAVSAVSAAGGVQ
jgi:hypothetical protein